MSTTNTAPRYRLVLDLTFPGTTPFDDDTCLGRLRKAMEAISDPAVTDVRVREALTISPDRDDYSDWRQGSGIYDPAKRSQRIMGNVGGVPPQGVD